MNIRSSLNQFDKVGMFCNTRIPVMQGRIKIQSKLACWNPFEEQHHASF